MSSRNPENSQHPSEPDHQTQSDGQDQPPTPPTNDLGYPHAAPPLKHGLGKQLESLFFGAENDKNPDNGWRF